MINLINVTTKQNYIVSSQQIQHEVVRKSIHILIAFVPLFASIDMVATMALLAGGTILYTYAEKLRLEGRRFVFVTDITLLAIRDRDRGKLVLGPITLSLGAMLSLLLYPEPASFIAIYALAFGDGFASLVGTVWGRIRIPFTAGKTVIGTLAGFVAVYIVTVNYIGSVRFALIIALTASLLELLPTRDADNLIIPVGTGLVASKLGSLLF